MFSAAPPPLDAMFARPWRRPLCTSASECLNAISRLESRRPYETFLSSAKPSRALPQRWEPSSLSYTHVGL
eukprot:2194039-Prymnesium_polylepis.1